MGDPDYERDEIVTKWMDELTEDDVETIDLQPCRTRLYTILFHLALSFAILGVCAGALIYSFERGEVGQKHQMVENRNASQNFTIFVNEFTATGVHRVTVRHLSDDRYHYNKMTVNTSKTFWYQNNDEKKIAHKVNGDCIAYVYEDFSYWLYLDKKGHPQSCHRNDRIMYGNYVKRLGLAKMYNEHSEMEITQNGRKVFIYGGDPTSVLLEGTDERAFLVRAYADQTSGALLGWDTYFGARNESKIYKTEYWYPNMVPVKPSDNIFDKMPGICGP
uniref:B30.2/SPRY domain-containing protein n=1 Tax=Steinernema glaseri TaxID=37863 RepID=A0A1I8A3B5_9BILA